MEVNDDCSVGGGPNAQEELQEVQGWPSPQVNLTEGTNVSHGQDGNDFLHVALADLEQGRPLAFGEEHLTRVVLEDFLKLDPPINVWEPSVGDIDDLKAWLSVLGWVAISAGQGIFCYHPLVPVLLVSLDLILRPLFPE